ncbi:YqkE family protein [Robertmurraya massiliosenegalensis]|uniref:YqkE family protein n=1 Tax=Robertmurraya massiliosenegalensis TaxID=1287657 RepID=UPI0002FD7A36|nr:YqkE family protein [Robertmurraya massiliosenegalensis]
MKKKKQKTQPKQKNDDKPVTLGDMLNADLLKQLKDQKQQLKDAEEKKQLEEEERKREERRLREKNKSFEELLNESPMDWKKFK